MGSPVTSRDGIEASRRGHRHTEDIGTPRKVTYPLPGLREPDLAPQGRRQSFAPFVSLQSRRPFQAEGSTKGLGVQL